MREKNKWKRCSNSESTLCDCLVLLSLVNLLLLMHFVCLVCCLVHQFIKYTFFFFYLTVNLNAVA